MKEFAPIVLFVYNRPEHTKRTIESLRRNVLAAESELFIFADGAKDNATNEQKEKVKQVREYLLTIQGFKTISIELSNQNKGLANSIISGVTKIVNKYGRVIVLEDDIITSSHFLEYVNQSLDLYESDEDVVCINSFCLIKKAPIQEHTYFQYGADCQGWATWKRGWDVFNPNGQELMDVLSKNSQLRQIFTYNGAFPYMEMLQGQIDGQIESWAIRWYASAVINKKLCLYPTKSLLQNIGFDKEGTHTQDTEAYEATIAADETTIDFPKIPIQDSKVMRYEWEKLFRRLNPTQKPSLFKRFKRRLKQINIVRNLWTLLKR